LFFLVVDSVGCFFGAGKTGGNFNLSVSNGSRFFWVSKMQIWLVSKRWLALCKPGSDVLRFQRNKGQNIKAKATKVQNQGRA
jgi:hypothetical protein